MYDRFLRRLFALALLCVALAACGFGQPPQPTLAPTPTPTPRELLASIGRATQASESLHFEIALSGNPVFTDSSRLFTLNNITGDLKRPDGVLATLKLSGVTGVTELRVVSLDGQFYLTNPITRQWQCLAPGTVFNPALLFDEQQGIGSLLQNDVTEVELLGTEDLAGQRSYHLRGTIAGERLQAISGTLLGGGPVSLEVWASTETLRATRLVLVDTATDAANPSTWTVEFSEYGKSVDIRAPVEC